MVIAIFLSEDLRLRNITHYVPKLGVYSYGCPEILYSTAVDMGFKGTRTQLKDYHVNIKYAVKFIAFLYKFFDKDWRAVIQYYKTGNQKGRVYYDRVMEIYNKTFQSA